MRFPSTRALLLAFMALLLPDFAYAQTAGGHVVLVLPFDNRTGNPSLNWIGDSFPDTLDQRLNSAGFLTISHDDRTYALDHLGLPSDFRPSRATTVRIAQQLDADYVVVGSYTVANNKISVQAQVLNVNALHLSAPLQDGAELPRLFDAENAIAWKIARQIDPHFNVAEQTFLASPGGVPLPSFENYIRGINGSTSVERVKRLQSAVKDTPTYDAALLALGKEQYAARDFTSAAVTLAKVPASDRISLEANFYLGLAHFNSTEYAQAETAFAFVAARLPLPEVINNQAVAATRQGKDAAALFQRASVADPSDGDYHYNLAVSLFRRGDTAGALNEADAALKLKPHDNEAVQLRTQLNAVPAGTKLAPNTDTGFSPVERIRRTYSEASFRQAAFQLDQMRALRVATLPPAEQVTQYTQAGRDYLAQGLLPEAEQEFQTALAVDQNAAAPHAGLAQVRERSGAANDARSEAEMSIRLSPSADALLILARLDLQANNLPGSAANVSKALKLEPKNTAAAALRNTLQSRGQSLP
jgi:tetratricopeptide (TPR) repeat protein/TolB-like protein